MSSKVHILFLSIAFCLISGCISEPQFQGPVPDLRPNLSSFRKEIRGEFEHEDGGSILTLTARSASRITKHSFWTNIHDLDRSATLENGILTVPDLNQNILVEQIGDSIYGSYLDTTLFFAISETHLLRRLKDSYYLNYPVGDGFYETDHILQKSKDSLYLFTFENQAEQESLENLPLLKSKTDSTQIISQYDPTKRQIKRWAKDLDYRLGALFVRKKEAGE